ncbi:neogenin-like isoform X2 [Symsagittifera roscoffensis]|uniref:neogenin-like isoform X2 n=1 Tax=Symsagittifera roscoffensis TaxID=84072 RepID=UPI00307C6304
MAKTSPLSLVLTVLLLQLLSCLHVGVCSLTMEKDLSFLVQTVKPFYSVTPGSSFTLSCPLDFSLYRGQTHRLTHSLFWYFNSLQISQNSQVYATTASRLHIPRITDAEYGNYSCRFLALDGASVTSPPMLLVKGSAPSLNKPVRTLDVKPNILFYIECLGNFGSPRGKVTWFKNNEEIPGASSENGPGTKTPGIFTSLPSGLLEVGGISQTNFDPDSQKFHCEVTNQHGKDTSGNLALRFVSPPGRSDFYSMENDRSSEVFVGVGERAVLECGPSLTLRGESSSSMAEEVLTWNKKEDTGTQLIDWFQYPEKYGILGLFNLEIFYVTSQDNGQYECIIQRDGRFVHINVNLQVVENPQVDTGKNDIEIKDISVHETTSFWCPINSQPKSEIKWLFNSIPISLGEFYKTNSEGTELSIYGIEAADQGIFQCLATNGFGWASTFGHLHVSQQAYSVGLLNNLQAPVSLLALTISSRFIQLGWTPPSVVERGSGMGGYHSDSTGTTLNQPTPLRPINIQGYEIRYWPAAQTNRFKMMKTRPGETSVNITDLTPRTSYSFKVRALDISGGYGAFSAPLSSPTLPEVLKPDRVQNLKADSVSSRQIELVWDELDKRFGVLDYEVLYREENTANGFSRTSVVTTNHFTAVGLQEFSRYNFMVRARNQYGFGFHCEPIREQTLADSPSGEPTEVKVFADSVSRLIIQWKPPLLQDWNGQLTGYYVKYRERSQSESKLEKYRLQDRELLRYISALDTGELDRSETSELVLGSLKNDTEYEVSVAAINKNGTGPYSAWIRGRTMENELPEVAIPGKCEFFTDVITDTSIGLRWRPPKNSNSTKIRHYRVQCNRLYTLPWDMAQVVDSRQFSFTFTDLEPDTTYICALLAWNFSPKMSDANAVHINVNTRVKQPLELPLVTPTNLKTLPLTEDSVSVRFDANYSRGQVFQIRCMPRIIEDNNIRERIIVVNTSNTYYYFSNLKPNTEYLFDVRAVRGEKSSDWGLQISGKTQEDVPGGPPEEFRVSRKADNALTALLNWKPPLNPNGKITGYLISYSQRFDEKNWAMEPVEGPWLETKVSDLQPSTIYYFKVQAKTAVGTGPWSYIKTTKTGAYAGSGGNSHHANGGGPSDSSEIGLRREHVYIIVAAVIGASLIVICLILAFVVCHVFSKTTSKHRLNPMQFIPTAETSSTMQTLQTFNNSNPPDLWVGHSQQGVPPGMNNPHNIGLEVKQIEQDALRKSPPSDTVTSQNGITYYQPPSYSQPNGYHGVTQYQPMMPDPQKMSPQGFSSHKLNPPPSLMQHQQQHPYPLSSGSNFPQLGRSAFMTAQAGGNSPLPATISAGAANYPKGFHEVPTIQSPTALNLQMMHQRTSQENPPQMGVPAALYSPNSNVSGTSSGGFSNQGNRSSIGGIITQFVRPSASTVVARSKPPSYPQPIPLHTSTSASTTGVAARGSDDTSSDRLNSAATEEDVNQATERMMELMNRVNQISNNL